MATHDLSTHRFQRKISDFCEVRIAPVASQRVLESIRPYLIGLVVHRRPPPIVSGRMDWAAIGQACGIEGEMTAELKKQLRPGLDAIIRWLGTPPVAEDILSAKPRAKTKKPIPRKSETVTRSRPQQIRSDKIPAQSSSMPRGPQPKPISPFPEPLFEATDDPASFQDALVYQMRRFGESYWQLYRAVVGLGETFDEKTLLSWVQGERVPRSLMSFEILSRIERRYRLGQGYFKAKLPHQSRSLYGHDMGEILKRMPDENRYPRAAAEAVRSFLLLRLGLHLGLRQKNLRQLRLCPRGHFPTSERRLEDMKCGELRWSDRENGWEVLIPSVAFKNSGSSFFGQKPFRLILPDLLDLYKYLEAYIDRHRGVLLGPAKDPGTFFVKTVKTTSLDAAYDSTKFYEAWRTVIQRYGIYNPYTGRGAIKGLLPHGPHNLRDILATHILKQTGSYEQASYAIQDTPDVVQQHYGRFLPQDKAALAAKILNQVWEAA